MTLSVMLLTLLITAIGVIIWSLHAVKKDKKRMIAARARRQRDMQSMSYNALAVNAHMKRLGEISLQQQEAAFQIEMPSKNALHSKYKSSLIDLIKELEEEKADTMLTILLLGFDPEIIYINEKRERDTMRMSEYLQKTKPHMLANNPSNTDSKKSQNKSRLTLIKGGKASD